MQTALAALVHLVYMNQPKAEPCNACNRRAFALFKKSAIFGAIFMPILLQEAFVNPIFADYSISMSDFKRNPAQVLRDAGEKPVAVLNAQAF